MSSESQPILLKKDCYECRITGTLSCAAIGAFVLYQSTSSYYLKRPRIQLAIRAVGAVFLYGAMARWFYLPPFHSLKGPLSIDSVE